MAAKVREQLGVNKQAAKKLDVERFNLRKLNELEVRKRYQIKISSRFAALENLSNGEDINRAWENITGVLISPYPDQEEDKLQRPNSNFCKPLKKKIGRLSFQPGLHGSNALRVG